MRVLVACEFSGIVREAFRKRGHDAWSCDLLPSEIIGNHLRVDVLSVLGGHGGKSWDMMIAFPPCTYLCGSGARWWKNKRKEQLLAIQFFNRLASTFIPKVAIENPIGCMSRHYRKPDQIIHPWEFGCGEEKKTCLWLKGLPLLKPTNIVEGRKPRVHWEAPSPDRWKNRSRTYQGIADAMADQWGNLPAAFADADSKSTKGEPK